MGQIYEKNMTKPMPYKYRKEPCIGWKKIEMKWLTEQKVIDQKEREQDGQICTRKSDREMRRSHGTLFVLLKNNFKIIVKKCLETCSSGYQ